MVDWKTCQGCYKHQSGVCSTYPECWFDKMNDYVDYERLSKISRTRTRSEIYMSLWAKEATDVEIAEKCNVAVNTVAAWRRRNNLAPNHRAGRNKPRGYWANMVRRYREAKGMSQAELSAEYGKAFSACHSWEHALCHPPEEVISDMLTFFGHRQETKKEA